MKKIIVEYQYLDKSEKLLIFIGILGLIPFIIGLLDIWINKDNFFFIINIPKYYGSIILSFLGAIYWGIVLILIRNKSVSDKLKLFMIIWSIIPSTIGIIVLYLKNNSSLMLLSLGFLLCQFIDEICNKHVIFPYWYLSLRRFLTLFVIITLLCTYFIIN